MQLRNGLLGLDNIVRVRRYRFMKKILGGSRLVLITLLAVCFGIMNVVEAGGQVQTVEADGYYLIGDGPDENHSVAKGRARMVRYGRLLPSASL